MLMFLVIILVISIIIIRTYIAIIVKRLGLSEQTPEFDSIQIATIIETNKLTQSRWDFYLNDPFGKYITMEKDDTEYVLKIKFGHRFIVRNLIRNKDRIDDTQHEYRRLLRMMIKHK